VEDPTLTRFGLTHEAEISTNTSWWLLESTCGMLVDKSVCMLVDKSVTTLGFLDWHYLFFYLYDDFVVPY
jgi:hypothetical protein